MKKKIVKKKVSKKATKKTDNSWKDKGLVYFHNSIEKNFKTLLGLTFQADFTADYLTKMVIMAGKQAYVDTVKFNIGATK